MSRFDGRLPNQLRPITIQQNFTKRAAGSVLISAGETVVLCTASVSGELPRWMPKDSTSGWVTAEYRMLPSSTAPRSQRADKADGRATEIQRLIGRSLRAVVDMEKLGAKTINIDCDVLQADGGTRTLSITGAYIALRTAIDKTFTNPNTSPLKDSVAAVSVGILNGVPILDLCYEEDHKAEVDMNIVMTGSGKFVEIQGTGEESTFIQDDLNQMLTLARGGIEKLLSGNYY